MDKIASFLADHRKITPGIYMSRIDGDVTAFDLRTKKPNGGDYMTSTEMHSVEHLFATYIRNSEIGENVVYFGPMGCRTGFYLLTRNVPPEDVLKQVKITLLSILSHEGPVFGASEQECGNYRDLNLEDAKRISAAYLTVLEGLPASGACFEYPC